MSRLRLASVGLLAVLCVELWALPSPAIYWVLAATFVITAAIMAYSVVSVRTRWIVPTVWRGARSGDQIALTFDDGPDP
ncbi:MAG: hypothetical protein ABIP94_19005, partial [Planctomycetota bacterium]